ncbi:MAG TPA: M48 family metallopeptidase [Planctomycetota bacterium]|nr:M48 family metallopeptidase [Planctomycetota bacterium]
MTSSPAPAPKTALNRGTLLAAFKGTIQPIRPSFAYRASLLSVFLLAVFLILIYVGMIAAAIAGVYLHATRNKGILDGRDGMAARLLVYFVPILAGVVGVAFMLKPLVARAPERPKPLSVTAFQEPFLFDLVKKLTELVGAPMPKRIDVDCQVNASASFGHGFRSLFSRDLVLTIGLPLAAGMSVGNLAGILSHELGHFAQGAGMRLGFMIRSINLWFARVVYERDAWDETLVEMSEGVDIRIGVIFYILRFLVWLMRRFLWVLMWISHGLSLVMIRQMEYDADQYEYQIVGSAGFREAQRRLPVLTLAWQGALADLTEAWNTRRRVGNLPRLVSLKAQQIPTDVRERFLADMLRGRGSLLDTHPPDQHRIDRAIQANAAGIFELDLPASAIFRDFEGLAKRATFDFYRTAQGDEVLNKKEVTPEELLGTPAEEMADRQALERFTQGYFNSRNPFFLPNEAARPVEDVAAAVKEFTSLGEELARLLPGSQAQFSSLQEQEQRVLRLSQLAQVSRSKLKFKPGDFDLKSADPDEINRVRGQALSRRSDLMKQLAPINERLIRRLTLALRLVQSSEISARMASDPLPDLLPRITALHGLRDAFPAFRTLVESFESVTPLFPHVNENLHNESLIGTIQSASSRWTSLLPGFAEKLTKVPFPYPGPSAAATLDRYVAGDLPHAEDLGAWIQTVNDSIDRVFGLYGKIMGELVALAEKVEVAVRPPA